MKYILTGGPSTGKTSIVKELQRRGYSTLDEVAREVLSEKRNLNWEQLQSTIFGRQLEKEEEFKGISPLFLDRGLPDVLAYCLHNLNYIPLEFAEFNFSKLYDKVFLLDRLPFKKDEVRIEKGDAEAQKIHDLISSVYIDLNYDVIRVPIFDGDVQTSVNKRADYILARLQ